MKNGQSLALALVRMLEKLHLSANQALCSAWLKMLPESSDLSLLKQHFQTTTPSTSTPAQPHTFTITPTPP
jgi:hypothetical protein